MSDIRLYNQTCLEINQLVTKRYSTSFSLGIRSLHKRFHDPIYAIYGFVRVADEIVDSFHDFDKRSLLEAFRAETFKAIELQISTNPVLQAFQLAVNEHRIDRHLVEAFLRSMEMDLDQSGHDAQSYAEYIYGSAEVVGLMCLRVFCKGDDQLYDSLVEPARKLGEAFQKINFLRDIQSDRDERGRIYFPGVESFEHFDQKAKAAIEADIQKDFDAALLGIRRLDKDARLGVYLAYAYYLRLFRKIRQARPEQVLGRRFRVSNLSKLGILIASRVRNALGVI